MNNFLDLRIMVYSNPLTVDKISKKFLYWKDSGFIYTRQLIQEMPENFRFYWIIPDKIKVEDYPWFLVANKNIELIPYPYSTSIHQNRYEFYGNVIKESFPYTKDVDVIINNQPEVSMNLRVWAQNQRRDDPLIFSFYHWIDCEESRRFAEELGGYFFRQYDGALASDWVYFHSDYAYNLFLRQQETYFGDRVSEFNYAHFHPKATLFGMKEFDLGKAEGKKIILFNHRLNNTTNWKSVINTLTELWKVRQDFILWMTDDSKIQEKSFLETIPFVVTMNVPPESYGYLIGKSHFGICNHLGYSTWNMALIDAFYNGCYMVAPRDGCYMDMLGKSFPGYHNPANPKELYALCESLLNNYKKENVELALDTLDSAPAFQDYHNEQSMHVGIDSIIRYKARQSKTPDKFYSLKTVIENAQGERVSKREIVNRFWSFHVNSNFQKIRWKLLEGGIRDDTTKSETNYYRLPIRKHG